MGEVIQLQGDQRKDVQEFLVDKKEGLELDAKTIKVGLSQMIAFEKLRTHVLQVHGFWTLQMVPRTFHPFKPGEQTLRTSHCRYFPSACSKNGDIQRALGRWKIPTISWRVAIGVGFFFLWHEVEEAKNNSGRSDRRMPLTYFCIDKYGL